MCATIVKRRIYGASSHDATIAGKLASLFADQVGHWAERRSDSGRDDPSTSSIRPQNLYLYAESASDQYVIGQISGGIKPSAARNRG